MAEPYTRYLMWLKSKQILNSMNNSWEEQAFAEDAVGPLGGFVWPPKSYSCSFCKREFRSAQALGGHMNVHRRDRAKLKQTPSSSATNEKVRHHDQPNLSHISDTILCPSYASSPSPASRVSTMFSQEKSSGCANTSPFEKNTTKGESMMLTNHDADMKTRLSIGTDLVSFKKPAEGSNLGETTNCKRHKPSVVSSLPLLQKPCSRDRYGMQDEALRIKVNSMEDIDLELRLGSNPPAVK